MSKSYQQNIRDFVIKDKLGVGSYGTIYRVYKQGKINNNNINALTLF